MNNQLTFAAVALSNNIIPQTQYKYGIKIWTLSDSNTSYTLNLQVYTIKESGGLLKKNQGARSVWDFTGDLRDHNVTVGNFFTTYNLRQLLPRCKITMLGTVRKNRKELLMQMTNKDF